MAVNLAMTTKVDHSTARSSRVSLRHAEQGVIGAAARADTTIATTLKPDVKCILTSVLAKSNVQDDKRTNQKVIDFILPI